MLVFCLPHNSTVSTALMAMRCNKQPCHSGPLWTQVGCRLRHSASLNDANQPATLRSPEAL